MQLFNVNGMGCSSCAAKMNQAITALDGTAVIEINLEQGRLMVESKLSAATICATLATLGFATDTVA